MIRAAKDAACVAQAEVGKTSGARGVWKQTSVRLYLERFLGVRKLIECDNYFMLKLGGVRDGVVTEYRTLRRWGIPWDDCKPGCDLSYKSRNPALIRGMTHI
jgi:hypothetical protein